MANLLRDEQRRERHDQFNDLNFFVGKIFFHFHFHNIDLVHELFFFFALDSQFSCMITILAILQHYYTGNTNTVCGWFHAQWAMHPDSACCSCIIMLIRSKIESAFLAYQTGCSDIPQLKGCKTQ